MEKLLEIKNLKVQYNTDEAVVYALNDFSLDLGKVRFSALSARPERARRPWRSVL